MRRLDGGCFSLGFGNNRSPLFEELDDGCWLDPEPSREQEFAGVVPSFDGRPRRFIRSEVLGADTSNLRISLEYLVQREFVL
jgi:hypothetical protein